MGMGENGETGQAGASAGSASPLAELDRLQQALTEAEERARSHWEQYLRAVADLDNVRKRAQRDIEQAHRYAIEEFAAELLAVHDSLALGLS
ncbi:MAG: nucleotide exchange factor GrpE, partial [Steroidobacteraceae bacterium]